MRPHPLKITVTLLLAVVLLGVAAPATRADLMIIGLDEKVTFDPASMRGQNP